MKKYLLPLILILFLTFSFNSFSWDVSTAIYADKLKNVNDEERSPHGAAFSSDGTKMYIAGTTSDAVYQYTLSPAWDVSTAEYANKSKSVKDEDTSLYGVVFNDDGTKMYIIGNGTDTVYQYTLDAWDVSTAIYAEKLKDVGDQDDTTLGMAFSSDGTKMYIMGYTSKNVFQYTLDTAWDVSTAGYADKFKNVYDEDTGPTSVFFNPDGDKMYIAGNVNDTIFQYTLDTAWDVSTAEYAEKFKNVGDQDGYPHGVTFNDDGTKMYIVGNGTDTVYQYTLEELEPPPSAVNVIFFGTNF